MQSVAQWHLVKTLQSNPGKSHKLNIHCALRWKCEDITSNLWEIQTVCWSLDSEMVLFATDQPVIYSVNLQQGWQGASSAITASSRAVEVADVTLTEVRGSDGNLVT